MTEHLKTFVSAEGIKLPWTLLIVVYTLLCTVGPVPLTTLIVLAYSGGLAAPAPAHTCAPQDLAVSLELARDGARLSIDFSDKGEFAKWERGGGVERLGDRGFVNSGG